MDELMEGSEMTLATRPTYFPLVADSKVLRSMRTQPFPPTAPEGFIILFRHNTNEVILEDLFLAFPEDD